MNNPAPLFLNCFSRGGSNILWNLFLTHPEACSPILETVQIFGAGLRHATVEGYGAALLAGQWNLFNQWNLEDRKPIPRRVKVLIDTTLSRWKLKTLQDEEMRYKCENEVYLPGEVEDARLVAKNNNGLIFLSDIFVNMYPDATFFALTRHPVALYESHRRHRTPVARSVTRFADFYNRMVERMSRDAERFERYHIIKFEDLLKDPMASLEKLYALAGLDREQVYKVRLKAKPHMHANGRHETSFVAGRHYWFEPGDLSEMVESNVNDFQIAQVNRRERDALTNLTAPVAACLGYV